MMIVQQTVDREIVVSVLCLAYNHKPYIRACLDGMLRQKTDFRFEVIVHDDASTDGTAECIRAYAARYPDIVVPIYQSENQYSKDHGLLRNIVFPRARGRYFALCDGDDCWLDAHKLQKQVEYMQMHPDCTLCFTNAQTSGRQCARMLPQKDRQTFYKAGGGNYSMGELVRLGTIPTSSLLFPAWAVHKLPPRNQNAYGGDTFLWLAAAALGYAHFLDENTCLYRTDVPGSVTNAWQRDGDRHLRFQKRRLLLLDDMDRFSGYRYHNDVEAEKVLRGELMARLLLFGSVSPKEQRLPENKVLVRQYIRTHGRRYLVPYALVRCLPHTVNCLRRLLGKRTF